ncbi:MULTISPECIES: DUF3987 domain-containing protein [Streptomyces]|uniref:DUF3987 domain-containing protein n=2 Tax=Streptomyces TaxID=1883 RepID=A0ABV9IV73_9ACTN
METRTRYDEMAYGPIGREVLESQPYTEADPIGVHAAMLALFSAALSGHVVQSGDRPIVVWTALVGRSGEGCKGTALEAAEHILYGLSDFLGKNRRGGISSGPSLINTLYEQYEKSLTLEDGPDGRIIVIEEEWVNQLKRTNRCPTFSGNFRTAWDGKAIRNTTKGKKGESDEQCVEKPLLGFHSHIQPGAWARYISDTEALGGSYNRILPVLVKMSKVLPSPEPGQQRPIFDYEPGMALKQAYDWARKEKRVMTLGVPARKRFDEIRAQFLVETAKLPEVLASFIERSAEQVWRVAAVLTAANKKTVIPLDAIEAAHAFVNYSVQSVTQLNNDTVSSTAHTPKALDDLIRRHLLKLDGEATRSQLYRALGSGRFTAEQIETEAVAMADVEVFDTPRKPGRAGAQARIFRLIVPEETATPIPAQTREPESVRTAEDAEALLNAYAEWLGKPGNGGKSVSDFLTSSQGPAKSRVGTVPAKRSASPRKATAEASKSAAGHTRPTSTRARGTAAKKAAAGQAKTPARTPVSAGAVKKAPAANPPAGLWEEETQ